MFNRLLNIALIFLLILSAIWIVQAESFITSLSVQVRNERSKNETLIQEMLNVENELVRARVQLRALTEANAVFNKDSTSRPKKQGSGNRVIGTLETSL